MIIQHAAGHVNAVQFGPQNLKHIPAFGLAAQARNNAVRPRSEKKAARAAWKIRGYFRLFLNG